MNTVPQPVPALAAAPGTAPRPTGLDVPRPSFGRLVRVELRKSVDTVTGRWLLAAMGLLTLGALALAATFQPEGQPADLGWLLTNGLIPVGLLLPVLGVLLLSGEFSTRSVLTTFVLVPSRGRVVVAKTVAAVLLAVVASVVAGLLAVAAAGVVTLVDGSPGWSVAPVELLQILLAQVVFVLVGVGFGLLCQNTPLAVVTYLVVPSLVAPVALLVPALQDVAPWIDLSAGTAALTTADGALEARQWAQVATVTALWAGLPFVLGWLRLQRREIA